jgi:hypothetical protein
MFVIKPELSFYFDLKKALAVRPDGGKIVVHINPLGKVTGLI